MIDLCIYKNIRISIVFSFGFVPTPYIFEEKQGYW